MHLELAKTDYRTFLSICVNDTILITDVEFDVAPYNSTFAQVKITPQCSDRMSMLDCVDLNYCIQDTIECKVITGFTAYCEKVSYCYKVVNVCT